MYRNFLSSLEIGYHYLLGDGDRMESVKTRIFVIAFCLLVIGGAAFFAIFQIQKNDILEETARVDATSTADKFLNGLPTQEIQRIATIESPMNITPTIPAALPTVTEAVFTYPKSFYITDIGGHRQVYSLGCEASAAVDWARYFDVPIFEYTFQHSLPISENPDYGFVGDVNSDWGQIPPYAYGVNAGPVAELLAQYGLPAKSVKGYTLDQVKQKLSESRPIIVWVIGNMEYSEPVEYVDSQGRSVIVAPYEHVVILTGYDETSIRYMTNGKFFDTPTEVFIKSWGVLGNMAVVYE